jgi:chorismate-pyruvate lyase
MIDLKSYPKALQLLMQTDGTVTELIKLLANENIVVIKLLEKIEQKESNILYRHIYLQGEKSKKNWLYAESKIYLDNLPTDFVSDLLDKTIPIGTLWLNYRMETFKQLINQQEEVSNGDSSSAFSINTKMLSRVYKVFNQNKLIMEITEKFPIDKFRSLA